MKSILFGIILMVAISALAGVILNSQERSSTSSFVSTNGSVRLSK